jgi:hypothetical protein
MFRKAQLSSPVTGAVIGRDLVVLDPLGRRDETRIPDPSSIGLLGDVLF